MISLHSEVFGHSMEVSHIRPVPAQDKRQEAGCEPRPPPGADNIQVPTALAVGVDAAPTSL